jgi:CDP-glucose 4,6-dehydratase
VRDVVSLVVDAWGGGSWELAGGARAPHEAPMLRLGIGKAVERLGWRPSWGLAESLVRTVRGYRALSAAGDDPAAVRALLDAEIGAYTRAARDAGATWAAGAGG